MEKKRTFFPDVETVYHKDYQTNYYRGVIVDQNSIIADRCRTLRASYDEAKADADEKWRMSPAYSSRSIAEIKKEREMASLDEMIGIWVPDKAKVYAKVIYITLFVIAVWIISGLIGGMAVFGLGGAFVLLIAVISIIVSQKKSVLSFGTFIWDKHLYIALLDNTRISEAMLLEMAGLSAVGLAVAAKGHAENKRYMDSIEGIDDILGLEQRKTVWKFTKIHEIKKVKQDTYKVRASYCVYSNMNGCFKDKEKNITFNLHRKYYEAFGQLLRCMEKCI